MSIEEVRKHVFNCLGDCEVWIDVMPEGDIFATSVRMAISKANFEIFLYDRKTGFAAMRLVPGMHKRMHDALETLPNAYDNMRLVADRTIATYRFPKELESECGVLEWHETLTVEQFMERYPEAVSLLVYNQ